MVYNAQNEVGYQIKTTRKAYAVVDFDGIPLMMRVNQSSEPVKHGFSNAAKFHRAKMMAHKSIKKHPQKMTTQIASIDLETTGLDVTKDDIISIGAVKRLSNGENDHFYRLVRINHEVPKKITTLTGISSEMLESEGTDLESALNDLSIFIEDATVVGYNLKFDELFLSESFKKVNQPGLSNSMQDLMPKVKKINQFLDNYRLETVLQAYEIKNPTPHHALADAQATLNLAFKLMENGDLKI